MKVVVLVSFTLFYVISGESIKGTAVWRLILQAVMMEIWKLFLNKKKGKSNFILDSYSLRYSDLNKKSIIENS